MALIVDQDVIWLGTQGFADLTGEEEVTPDTVFKLWSLGKLLTALEVMRLVEEGELDLDAPITDYVPSFRINSRFDQGGPITIRHLLAHRSGLPRNSCVDDSSWDLTSEGPEHLAEALASCYLAYPTGSRYHYSNTAYDLLGYLIQAKRGDIFPPYMSEHVLRPMGMRDAAFWSADVPGVSIGERHIASGYEYFEGEYYPLEQYDVATISSGNLYGSIEDLAAFVRFIFRDGRVDGQQLIAAETLEAMTVDQFSHPEDPQLMGLGWKLAEAPSGEKLAWHDGGPSEGSGVLVAVLPERKVGVAMIGNGTAFESSATVPVAVELLEVMLETETGITPADESIPEPIQLENESLEKLEGTYVAFNRPFEVGTNGGRLTGSIEGLDFNLIPRADGSFSVSHWMQRLRLDRLLSLPMDLEALRIRFESPGDDPSHDLMIIDLGGFSYEIAPRFPVVSQDSASAEDLAGAYERRSRLRGGTVAPDVVDTVEIRYEDGRLIMSDPIGPLALLDDGTLLIVGGPFAGETIERHPSSGDLYHQGHVYSRAEQ